MKIKGSSSKALETLRGILAKDDGRKARIQAMADSIREKAIREPSRILCGETFEALRSTGSEG